MDPLSVSASIAGLLSAAGTISKVLGPYIAAAQDVPKIAAQVSAEVHEATIVLSALDKLARNMTSVSVQRAALVSIDQVVAVLTNGVLVFSDLEASVGRLPLGESSFMRMGIWSRLQWARKEAEFTVLLSRLQGFKSSASLILNILQRSVPGCFTVSQPQIPSSTALANSSLDKVTPPYVLSSSKGNFKTISVSF